jgi:hypothetical protein
MGQQFGPGTQLVPVRGMAGFGMMSGSYNGPAVWEGRWDGATFTSPHMPAFYANRMGIMTVPGNGNWGMRIHRSGAGYWWRRPPRAHAAPGGEA